MKRIPDSHRSRVAAPPAPGAVGTPGLTVVPKPAWRIRANYGKGELCASLPAGLCATAPDAIRYYTACRGLVGTPLSVVAVPV